MPETLLIRRRRPIGEPASLLPAEHAVLATGTGTAGAGRICAALLELGVGLDGVRQAVVDPAAAAPDLDGIDLGERFKRVVLGSHLVNLPEEAVRVAWLGLTARHLAEGGELLVEHHPLDWAETAADVAATPGSAVGMQEVRREPPFVSAVSVYDVGGRIVRQPFTARVLSDEELRAALASAGLSLRRRLGPTWIAAGR